MRSSLRAHASTDETLVALKGRSRSHQYYQRRVYPGGDQSNGEYRVVANDRRSLDRVRLLSDDITTAAFVSLHGVTQDWAPRRPRAHRASFSAALRPCPHGAAELAAVVTSEERSLWKNHSSLNPGRRGIRKQVVGPDPRRSLR